MEQHPAAGRQQRSCLTGKTKKAGNIKMKIMVMSDLESNYIWDHYQPGMFKGIDLILSAGDLNSRYLTFVESMSNMPLLYIHGNHDGRYSEIPPEGCQCIEDQIYMHDGVRILGLGGSMRYSAGKHQYTEKDMQRRIRRLKLKLMRTGGFDILLAHSPVAGFHDTDDPDDPCHHGFEALGELLDKYQPKYFIHGHVHMNYGLRTPRLSLRQNTVVINAFRTYTFDYDDPAVLEEAGKITE